MSRSAWSFVACSRPKIGFFRSFHGIRASPRCFFARGTHSCAPGAAGLRFRAGGERPRASSVATATEATPSARAMTNDDARGSCTAGGYAKACPSLRRDQGGAVELRPLGTTGIRVSELCLGAMTFGREADEATSVKMVDRFLDA